MRAVFDFIKDIVRKADGLWIESAGHPVIVTGFLKKNPQTDSVYIENQISKTTATPVVLYGFYDYEPAGNYLNMFGVDAPDEMEIDFNAENMCKKYGKFLEIGAILRVEDANWAVVQRKWIYNRFVGKYRLRVTVMQYQESVTTGEGKKPKFEKKRD